MKNSLFIYLITFISLSNVSSISICVSLSNFYLYYLSIRNRPAPSIPSTSSEPLTNVVTHANEEVPIIDDHPSEVHDNIPLTPQQVIQASSSTTPIELPAVEIDMEENHDVHDDGEEDHDDSR